ncbi:MAG: hypothetical protein HZA61_00820 [Candidatus Eisenbacteria bacterium]|uniref:DUF6265 domain-containing protein n=1 Tax=Eiseniibacteriota bacterium TaxID=2212470 RepID=A0A933SAS1_UNCEI|nr:hypothetical protein [Candidatus Eisenbacteria bacterium]
MIASHAAHALHALACAAMLATANARPFTLADLDWIEGTWRAVQTDATGVRSEAEEHWGAAIGESRLGWFRSVRAGEARFYEFEVMRRDSAGVSVHVKHFGRDVTGWEAPDSASVFRLVRLGEREALFEDARDTRYPHMRWLVRGDSLHVTLTSAKPGARALEFGFARAQPPAAAPEAPKAPAGPAGRPEHPE